MRRPELIVEVSHGVGCDRAGNGGGTSSSSADTPAFDDEDGSPSSDGDADAHALDSGGASEADGDDGLDDSTCEWLPFEFHFKPGNAARAPAWVAVSNGQSVVGSRQEAVGGIHPQGPCDVPT